MQHSKVKTCTVSFVIALFLMGSAGTPLPTLQSPSTTINSRVEIEDMLPSQIHEMSFKDVKEFNVKRPEMSNGYKPHFLPIYIQGNDDLTGLRGILNGVRGGEGTEDNPYVISGWELRGWKYWKLVGRHYAITIENVDKHVVIKDNYIHGWWYSIGGDYVSGGIFIGESSNITIENNVIEENRLGISSGSSSSTITRFNSISKNGCGIAIAGSHVVTNNTIFNNYGDGIVCGGPSAHAYIAFNNIFSNGLHGIFSGNRDRSLIEYNTIYDNADCGIGFGGTAGGSSHPTIANNEIFSNGRWGIGCFDPTEAVIRNNSIYSNHADGISCHDSNPTIIDNIISSNGGDGIDVVDGNPDIAHNLITSHHYGINSHGDDPMILSNVIASNGVGCYIIDHPELHYNNFEGNNYAIKVGFWQWPLINATHNWWDSSDGPGGYGPGSGDPVSDHVDYNPWLTEPNPDAGPR